MKVKKPKMGTDEEEEKATENYGYSQHDLHECDADLPPDFRPV